SPADSVFINCPFDSRYQPIFEAIVFCVAACGFVPRCALELTDAGEVRIENIYRLIDECHHGIHDISRTEVRGQPYGLPRFNMPLELGIFLRAKRFGKYSAQKRVLILDREPYATDVSSRTLAGRISKLTAGAPRERFAMCVTGFNPLRAKPLSRAAGKSGKITAVSGESFPRSPRRPSSIPGN